MSSWVEVVIQELVDCIVENVPCDRWPPFVAQVHRGGGCADDVKVAVAINWDSQPLGEEPDGAIAARLGVVASTVRKQRRKRGIPPLGRRCRGPRAPGDHAGIIWDDQPLGRLPDAELARRLGVDASSVRGARRVRSIPAYSPACREEDEIQDLVLRRPEPEQGEPEPELAEEPGPIASWLSVARAGPQNMCPLTPAIPKVEHVSTRRYGGKHTHKCPMCGEVDDCDGESCEVDEDGLGRYRTCEACSAELDAETGTTGQRLSMPITKGLF